MEFLSIKRWLARMEAEAPEDPFEATIYWANISVREAKRAQRLVNIWAVLTALLVVLFVAYIILTTPL